jgi:tyrosine-protein kinase
MMAGTEVLDLRDYTQSIYRRRRWVVVSTVLGVILALGLSVSQRPSYRSSTEVLVLPATVPGVSVSPNAIISMPNELEIARSASVAQAAERLASDRGFQIGSIQVTNPTDTQTLGFRASASDATAAQATASAYADAYLEFRKESLTSSIDARLTSVRALLTTLDEERKSLLARLTHTTDPGAVAAAQSELSSVTEEISLREQEENELELASKVEVGRLLADAVEPTNPSSPRPIRDAIIGAALGFLVGVGLALLRDRLDERVRDRDDVVMVTGAPMLGLIPEAKSLHRMIALLPGGDQAAAEAFRTLRTRVLFSAAREGFSSIMVTSAAPFGGKTTTAVNLAFALAQADTRVVLVSADLHRPGLWRYLPERARLGLADVLDGTAVLSDVVVPTLQENLSLLPSGTLAKLPEAGLGSALMMTIIEQLKAQSDLVILDSSPVLGVSDTLELASIVDAVLLTVDATQAKKSSLRETVSELESVGATIMGAALIRPEKAHFEGYTYGYGYRAYADRSTDVPAGALATLEDAASSDEDPYPEPASASAAEGSTRPAERSENGGRPGARVSERVRSSGGSSAQSDADDG